MVADFRVVPRHIGHLQPVADIGPIFHKVILTLPPSCPLLVGREKRNGESRVGEGNLLQNTELVIVLIVDTTAAPALYVVGQLYSLSL